MREGLVAESMEWAIASDGVDDWTRGRLSEAFAAIGEFERARQLIDAVQRPEDRVRYLTSLVVAMPAPVRAASCWTRFG